MALLGGLKNFFLHAKVIQNKKSHRYEIYNIACGTGFMYPQHAKSRFIKHKKLLSVLFLICLFSYRESVKPQVLSSGWDIAAPAAFSIYIYIDSNIVAH